MFWNRSGNRASARTRQGGKQSRGWMLRMPQVNWRRVLPIAGGALAVVAGMWGIRLLLDQPVQQVEISGRFQRVQVADVQKAVRAALGHQGMVSVNLDKVGMSVHQVPWVDRVSVARSWPRGLVVEVIEQIPVARWGKEGLLNARGEMFVRDTEHLPAELPELVGPAGTAAAMTERFLAIQPRLAGAGLNLTQLRLDERGAWEVEFDSGVQLRLGRSRLEDPVDLFKERFDRFMLAASRIVAARAREISYVDLRYSNGFAIGWRTAANEVKGG